MREFWLVDPAKKSVLVYGFKDFEIDEYTTYKLEDTLISYYFEGLVLAVKDIFEE